MTAGGPPSGAATSPADGPTPLDRAAVERWIAVDDEYGAELAALLADEPEKLAGLFDGRVAFGTAGLRAAMGPGPTQMNRLVVQQTTAGLMDWLPTGATVVVGYDARHHSQRFAADVVDVVRARGGTAELIDRPAPTPVLARAVLDRRADAGVMITASHNPATDNGYKLYLADGIQLVGPADTEIAAAIERAAAAVDPGAPPERRWRAADPSVVPGPAPVDITDGAIERHQAAAVAALRTDHREVRLLYTAMHGVGGRHLLDCLARAGFPEARVVAAQFDPDPDFPTAPFPNPEEPGAFDLAIAEAGRIAADDPAHPVDVIIANDPDADRLAAAVVDGDGRWRRLTGDEVGALLADHVLGGTPGGTPGADDGSRTPGAADDGSGAGAGDGRRLVASSIVSSRFIDRLAEAAGAESIRTLTGFKWVARPIVDRPGDTYLMGYEEALGYCIGDRVRDKDGISAALVLAELAAGCAAAGTTLWQRLNGLIERHGLYATSQVTIRFDHLDGPAQDELKRRAVTLDPADIGGVAVVDRQDLAKGERLPPTDGVVLGLADDSRVIVRPSGTEPKLKAYLEVVEAADRIENAEEARHRAELRLAALATAVEALLGAP